MAALDTLEAIGTSDVLPPLVEALGHPQLAVRSRASEVLKALSLAGQGRPRAHRDLAAAQPRRERAAHGGRAGADGPRSRRRAVAEAAGVPARRGLVGARARDGRARRDGRRASSCRTWRPSCRTPPTWCGASASTRCCGCTRPSRWARSCARPRATPTGGCASARSRRSPPIKDPRAIPHVVDIMLRNPPLQVACLHALQEMQATAAGAPASPRCSAPRTATSSWPRCSACG